MTALFDQGPPPPCPQPFNLAAHVLARAGEAPDKAALAIVGPDAAQVWTYAEITGLVRSTAAGFLALGLCPGDRILMRIGNTVEFPLTYLAAIAAGLVPVATSAQLTAPEITAMAAPLSPALIVAAPGVALPDTLGCPVLDLDGLHSLAGHAPAPFHLGDPNRPAYIIFTSGTSGQPRAVVHAHRAVWARQMMMQGWYGLGPDDRMFHAGAFNWTYTLGTGLLDPWTMGATALIPAPGTATGQFSDLLLRHEATLFAAAPGVYRQVLRQPLPVFPHLCHGLSAGEKLSASLRAAWQTATGCPIFEAFGMSECSTFLSGSPARPAPDGASGYPQPGRRVAILSPEGQPVDYDQPGTIAIAARDPGLMLEYLGAPEDTRARYTDDGQWFVTGDIASMAPDGAITYLGRDDDMMNAGGYRVSPLEVESVLLHHPDITDAAAIEVRVKADTTVIAAVYCAAQPLDPADLVTFASGRLARYKCPKIYLHSPALPRGANGKVLRRQLRRAFEASNPDGQT